MGRVLDFSECGTSGKGDSSKSSDSQLRASPTLLHICRKIVDSPFSVCHKHGFSWCN